MTYFEELLEFELIEGGYRTMLRSKDVGGDIVVPAEYCGLPVVEFVKKGFGVNLALTSIVLPDTVVSIGKAAFNNCQALSSVTLGKCVTLIDDEAFSQCKALLDIVIPASVVKIGSLCFHGCNQLKSITFEQGSRLEIIGSSAFGSCGELAVFDMPKSVRLIGDDVFAHCKSLTYIALPASLTTMGNKAFRGSHFSRIEVDEDNPDFKSIDGNLYTRNGKILVRYAVGRSDDTFILPKGVTTINEFSFAYCYDIVSVVLSDRVEKIGLKAFFYCKKLKVINIPDRLKKIDVEAFAYCQELIAFDVSEANPIFKSIDGNLYSKDGREFIRYAPARTNTTFDIPNGVVSVGAYAFDSAAALINVNFPNGVGVISERAFYNCKSLTAIDLPSSVSVVGKYAFAGCESVKSLTLCDTLKTIGVNAFDSKAIITDYSIPEKILKKKNTGINIGK